MWNAGYKSWINCSGSSSIHISCRQMLKTVGMVVDRIVEVAWSREKRVDLHVMCNTSVKLNGSGSDHWHDWTPPQRRLCLPKVGTLMHGLRQRIAPKSLDICNCRCHSYQLEATSSTSNHCRIVTTQSPRLQGGILPTVQLPHSLPIDFH